MISFLLMKVANDKEARIEKNTKELGTFVILNQKSVLDYLDQILEKFENDRAYREKTLKQMVPERKYRNTKKDQDYKVISRILKDEMGLQGVGQTTIWRLLRIRKESPELYEKIRENRISIRHAYEKLSGEGKGEQAKGKPQKESKEKNPFLFTRGSLDFTKMKNELKAMNKELKKTEGEAAQKVTLKKLKEIDEEIYTLRKSLGTLIKEYDDIG